MGKHKKNQDHSPSKEDKESVKLRKEMKKFMAEVDRRFKERDRSVSRERREYSRDRHRRRDCNERRRSRYDDRGESSDDRSRSVSRSHRSVSQAYRTSSRSYHPGNYTEPANSGSYHSKSRSRHSSQESKPSSDEAGEVTQTAALTTSGRQGPVPAVVVIDDNPGPSETQAQPEHEVDLQEEILNIMGPRLEVDKQKVVALHKDIVIRWTEIFKQGLPKEEDKKLLGKYQIPENCNFVAAPKLNPEVVSAVQENVKTRDKRIIEKQERIASCLAAVGTAISITLKTDGAVKLELIEILSDVGRLLAFLQREESEIRKNLILANLNSSVKDILKGSTVDGFLFGDNLEEKIKTAKTLERASKDLKPSSNPLRPRNAKNQRGPPAQRQSMYSRNPQTSGGLKKPTPSSSNSRSRKPYPRKQQQPYRRR